MTMSTLMLVCTVANVVQAILYHRMTGRFQTMFWCLALFSGGVYAIS